MPGTANDLNISQSGLVVHNGSGVFTGVTLTAGTGINISNGSGISGNPTISLTGGGIAVEHLTGTTGGALNPDGSNNFNLLAGIVAAGTTPIAIAGSGSTLTTNIQTSQSIAAADATKIGLSNFSSSGFGVTATGFVTLVTSVAQLFTANTGTATPSSNNLNVLGGGGIQTAGSGANLTIAVSGGGFTWVDATSATQSLAVQTGYVTDHSATVVYTLPATAVLGDTIKIVGKLGLATITPNANQQILIGLSSGAVGVTGTAVSNNVGDCIDLVCITAGASCVFRADNIMGTWTLTT